MPAVASSAFNTPVHHPAVWRGAECAQVSVPSVPTGFAELDVLLPGAGWPTETLTEIYVERPGIGEVMLLVPALARLSRSERWLAFIAPPYLPYAPALASRGIRLSQFMLIRAQTAELQLWSGEQALRSGSCGAVLLWLDRVPERALRRLQLAAEGSGAFVMLFRNARAPACSTPSVASSRRHLQRGDAVGPRAGSRSTSQKAAATPARVKVSYPSNCFSYQAHTPPARPATAHGTTRRRCGCGTATTPSPTCSP